MTDKAEFNPIVLDYTTIVIFDSSASITTKGTDYKIKHILY